MHLLFFAMLLLLVDKCGCHCKKEWHSCALPKMLVKMFIYGMQPRIKSSTYRKCDNYSTGYKE
jgi:hypothetical protein